MLEKGGAIAAALAMQMLRFQCVASRPRGNADDQVQAARAFLDLVAKHPDVAEEYGFSVNKLRDRDSFLYP